MASLRQAGFLNGHMARHSMVKWQVAAMLTEIKSKCDKPAFMAHS